MTVRLVTVAVRQEQDVVSARQRARQLAALLGFEAQDQARIATAVSEIVRNAFRYAGGGEVEFSVEGERPPQLFAMEVRDRGPGIANLETVLGGTYRSDTAVATRTWSCASKPSRRAICRARWRALTTSCSLRTATVTRRIVIVRCAGRAPSGRRVRG